MQPRVVLTTHGAAALEALRKVVALAEDDDVMAPVTLTPACEVRATIEPCLEAGRRPSCERPSSRVQRPRPRCQEL